MSKFDPNAFARRATDRRDLLHRRSGGEEWRCGDMNVAEEAVRASKAEHPTAADTVDEIAEETRGSAVRFGAAGQLADALGCHPTAAGHAHAGALGSIREEIGSRVRLRSSTAQDRRFAGFRRQRPGGRRRTAMETARFPRPNSRPSSGQPLKRRRPLAGEIGAVADDDASVPGRSPSVRRRSSPAAGWSR